MTGPAPAGPDWTPQPALKSALLGLCPRCGAPGLFKSIASFAYRCRRCDLDFQCFNVGDGAAPFLIFLVGAVVIGLAMWLELSRAPPWWVHVVLWVPLTIVLTVALLRVAKGLLVAFEFRNDAGPGRLQ